ncbi:MAG: DMT family transporter [Maricaulaceae bacterium]
MNAAEPAAEAPPQPTPRDWAFLLALIVMWGSAFAAIRIAVGEVSPSLVVFGRLSLGAGLLTGYALVRGRRFPPLTDLRWLWFFALGLTGNAIPFSLISWAQTSAPSSVAGVFMALVPLLTIGLAHVFVPGEQATRRKIMGFALGFTGLMILLAPGAAAGFVDAPLGPQLALLAAASSYAVSGILAKRAPETSPSVIATAMLSCGALATAPLAAPDLAQMAQASPQTWVMIVALGAFPTAIASILYVQVVRRVGPSFLSLTNYFVPLWAVGMGALVFAEPLPATLLGALTVILIGLVIARPKTAKQ